MISSFRLGLCETSSLFDTNRFAHNSITIFLSFLKPIITLKSCNHTVHPLPILIAFNQPNNLLLRFMFCLLDLRCSNLLRFATPTCVFSPTISPKNNKECAHFRLNPTDLCKCGISSFQVLVLRAFLSFVFCSYHFILCLCFCWCSNTHSTSLKIIHAVDCVCFYLWFEIAQASERASVRSIALTCCF